MNNISTYTLVNIRQDYLKGFSVDHLASKYEVSQSTIREYTKKEKLLLQESYILSNKPLREISLEEYDELQFYILSGVPIKEITYLTGLTKDAINSYGLKNLEYRTEVSKGNINPLKVSPPYIPSNVFKQFNQELIQYT